MSNPSVPESAHKQDLPISHSNLKENLDDESRSDKSPQQPCHPTDEYTTLLKKHLDVVESELSRLKSLHNDETGVIDGNGAQGEAKVAENDKSKQEAKIYRIAPWKWREVKKERTINQDLPTLLASSKGHGRVGRRSAGRRTTKNSNAGDGGDSVQEGIPTDIAYRVAINSRILLNVLGDLTGMDFPEDRNVWLRPFKYLVAYEAEIRQASQDAENFIRQLEAETAPSDQKIGTNTKNEDTTSILKSIPNRKEEKGATAGLSLDTSPLDISRVKAEGEQLRCLVNFMDTDMQDIFDIKQQVATQTLEKVAFEHLWLLYKPGDLVYTKSSLEDHDTYQAYRVLHVTGGRPILDTVNMSGFNAIRDRDWEDESGTEERAKDTIRGSPSNMTPFIIDCFSIDCDGSRYGPKTCRFVMPTYSGKRKVDTLEPCPSFCHPHQQDIYQALAKRGSRFMKFASGTHKLYSGMTLRESRELWETLSYYNYVIHDEEVFSEIIIDQAAAVTHFRKNYTRWKLKIGGRIIGVSTAADRREVFDPFPVKRDEDLFSDVFDDSIIDLDRRNEFVNSTDLLKYHKISETNLSNDYVMLLPFRIYGYAMLNRKWLPMNINLVKDITPEQVRRTADGYEDLVLPEGHKKLLQAIVKNQVRDPKQTRSGREEVPNDFQMDVVQGKGRGLIILLHGAPGVGKTSTAECVAAQLKRPLLPITCGDISTNVKTAEETLSEYCALAYRWRCVLLLDEADVFLAKREKGDIQRNGLVSVFLRVLEYFSGVIILTTNRVGEFDEAFRSRIHISLYYPKLDQNTTMLIWERNLLRLRKSPHRPDFSDDEIRAFASQHWLDNVDKPSRHWNGRQIKNAFQTALALANWEFYEMKMGQRLERPLLKAKHFNRVAQTSAHFDDYISDVYNISDDTFSVLAARDEIRKDTHLAAGGALDQRSTRTQGFIPRSKRTAPAPAPARQGLGMGTSSRDARGDQGGRFESTGDSAEVKQLELELKIMKLKQASKKEETPAQAQTQAGDDYDDGEEEEEGW